MPPSKRANAAQNAHASCTSIVVGVTTLIVAHAHLSRVELKDGGDFVNAAMSLGLMLFAALGAMRRTMRDASSTEVSTFSAYATMAPVWALCAVSGTNAGTRLGRATATAFSAAGSVAYVDAWTPSSEKKTFISALVWMLAMRLMSGAFAMDAVMVAFARACAWGLAGAAAPSETTLLSVGAASVMEMCVGIYRDVGTRARASESSALAGAFAIAGVGLLLASARLVCWPTPASKATQFGVLSLALSVPEWFYRVSNPGKSNMILGVVRYTMKTNMETLTSLTKLWCTGLAVALGVAYNAQAMPLTMRRKAFHFLAIVMFAPTLMPNSGLGELIRVAFAVAFALFACVECARVFDAYYGHGLFGWKLSVLLAQFVGDGVVSLIILDHFSLLLGIAVPVWLSGDSKSLVPWAGVLTLGVGDSFASIVGGAIGRRKVFGERSSKTLEGAIAFAVSTFVAASYVGADISASKLAGACVAAALFELSVEGVSDNFVLPLYFAALVAP